MYNFYYKHNDGVADFAVLAIPRCGSESTMSAGRYLTARQAALLPRIVAFIRDPLERLRSGFQFFLPYPLESRYAPTWEAWVDRVLDAPEGADYLTQPRTGGRVISEPTKNPIDPHWLPQSTLINEAPVPVTEIWAFEKLTTVIPYIGHYHASRPVTVNAAYRISELRTYYAADSALRLTARVV